MAEKHEILAVYVALDNRNGHGYYALCRCGRKFLGRDKDFRTAHDKAVGKGRVHVAKENGHTPKGIPAFPPTP